MLTWLVGAERDNLEDVGSLCVGGSGKKPRSQEALKHPVPDHRHDLLVWFAAL